MKKLILFPLLIFVLLINACGTTEENMSGTVNENENNKTTDETEEAKKEENEINKVIVDNENVKATLVKIVKKNDDIFGNSVEVVFDIQNKRKDTIEVQARNVSVDDRMVDETILSMSQEIAAGKSATASLTINEFEGYDMPKFDKNFEMKLYFFSWDNMDFEEEHPVKVTF